MGAGAARSEERRNAAGGAAEDAAGGGAGEPSGGEAEAGGAGDRSVAPTVVAGVAAVGDSRLADDGGVASGAAVALQRWWRALRPRMPRTSIELGWSGARARRLGALEAHVRYLQYIFRRSVELRPGCWRRGGMRGLMSELVSVRATRCKGGENLAGADEFDAQSERAARVLDWYRQYVQLLRRLMSGAVPSVVDDFCGGGGASEGVRRGGGVAHGIDSEVQTEFVRRFGAESFTKGDGVSWSVVAKVLKRARAVGGMASPPCKFYSTARVRGEAKAPPLIDQTRDMLNALFEFWVIENVLGARSHLAPHAVELRGAWFGLRVDRPRLFEASFGIHVDEYLREPGERLRARCCLGARRRWRRLDAFGRPARAPAMLHGQPLCRAGKHAVAMLEGGVRGSDGRGRGAHGVPAVGAGHPTGVLAVGVLADVHAHRAGALWRPGHHL